MARALATIIAGVLALSVCGGLLWYLAYGLDARPPERVSIRILNAPVQIEWAADGRTVVRAQTIPDAYAALGYVHGQRRAWTIALWRQAATGTLSTWFDDAALPLDRLTRQLALAANAESAYRALDTDTQELLRAYTAGLNAALAHETLHLRPEFVLLNAQPAPWEPWHTLAVERLLAWLGTPEASNDATGSPPADFTAADSALRQWLLLHGFENSISWVARDSTGTHLFQRHVYGSSALPFLEEVSIHLADSLLIQGGSIPGTPFFPAGKTNRHAWSVHLVGTRNLDRVAVTTANLVPHRERVRDRDGEEHLITAWRMDPLLLLDPPPPRPDRHVTRTGSPAADAPLTDPSTDTLWALRWSGLTSVTDCESWIGLVHGTTPSFELWNGDGLRITRDGTWHVMGSPASVVSLEQGTFIGHTFWSTFAGELLRTQESGSAAFQHWIHDTYSIWAAQIAPVLLDLVGQTEPSTPIGQEAMTYLRNWDFAYDRASIGASIFDTWMTLYRDTTGILPARVIVDTTAAPDARAYRDAFERAVAQLSDRFGSDLSRWRWERVQPERRFFPIWSVDSLYPTLDLRARERYAPIAFPGIGHPSTLVWGTTAVQKSLAATSSWEARVTTGEWELFHVRRRSLDVESPLGRYLLEEHPPSPVDLYPSTTDASTLLIP